MTINWSYRKKVIALSILFAALALTYILSFVFEPGRDRHAVFAWLEPRLLDLADRVEVYGSEGGIILSRINNIWCFSVEGRNYPVKQARVDDLFSALSRKARYLPVLVSSAGSDRLALSEERASRIIIRGGAGLPLLDLLVGSTDALGREVYLRRAGTGESYTGEDRFTWFTESGPVSWLDLRLFPEESRSVNLVQQADVYIAAGETGPHAFSLRRSGSTWVFPDHEDLITDSYRVESWLRSVLEAEGEGFSPEDWSVMEGSITLHLGDGSSRLIQLRSEAHDYYRIAKVAGSSLSYILSEWTIERLFREREYFIR